MRVVWIYRDYRKGPERYRDKVHLNCELSQWREFKVFSCGVASWQALEPSITRVLYVDKYMYESLNKRKGFLQRFDEIQVVDFENTLDLDYPDIDFFAAPKLWVLTQQEEPFILSDTETVLLRPFSECKELDLEKYNFLEYGEGNPMRVEHWTEQDHSQCEEFFTELSKYVRYFNPKQMIEAGFSNYPDPEVAKEVGKILLEICNEVCISKTEFPKKWTFCEESILVPVVTEVLKQRGYSKDLVKVHKPFKEGEQEVIEFSSPGYVGEVYWGWFRDTLHNLKYRDQIAQYDPYGQYYVAEKKEMTYV